MNFQTKRTTRKIEGDMILYENNHEVNCVFDMLFSEKNLKNSNQLIIWNTKMIVAEMDV